ncbi:MAG: 50S ribosome-binding GTPase [Candidatus Diapherotrites archaeon]|uniref:50S ribosome-binding GTPase n=1 Tax=Candidatus Iainarchaeum sp. TaxID=3101447 RepID=A0A8T3YN70_9ARCH|nr:50S ribosome-binding GTPase [Candidatus Diapherotrites archaeon]
MGYWDMVKRIVMDASVVVEVIDSRFPAKTRIPELENLVAREGKKLLIVINKADMISKREAEREKLGMGTECVFVSAKKRQGVTRLRMAIARLAGGEEAKVAVVGYPNTGKSSVINMLKGRKAARTSSIAGFTKGKQFVRAGSKLLLIDSPGIIPIDVKDETLMVLLSVKNFQHLKDLEGTAMDVADYLLRTQRSEIVAAYGIDARDGEELLEKLAFSRKKLVRGGRPDINAAARILIMDFQEGKIRFAPENVGKQAGTAGRPT